MFEEGEHMLRKRLKPGFSLVLENRSEIHELQDLIIVYLQMKD